MQRLFPAVLIMIAVGIFFTYTSPAFNGPVSTAQAKIKSYNSALEAAENFKDREAQLQIERAAIEPDDLARLEAFLPDSVNNIQLILDLDALAAKSGVRLSNFNIEEPSAPGAPEGELALESTSPVGSIEITVTAVGSYMAFNTFLEAAEKSLRLLDVVGLSVKGGETGVYTYDVTFRIYWLQ